MNAMSREPGYDGDPATVVELKDFIDPETKKARTLTARVKKDVLDRLLDRGEIYAVHHAAGRKFQEQGAKAEGRPVAARSDGLCSSGYGEPMAVLEATEARKELRRVLSCFERQDEVFLVALLHGERKSSMTEACRFVHWDDHAGPVALRILLWVLAREYGLA